MKSEIFVIDNFYDIPYEYHKSFLSNEVRVIEETGNKISSILKNSSAAPTTGSNTICSPNLN